MEYLNKYISKSEIDSYVSKIEDGTFFDEFDTIKEDNCNPYNFNDNIDEITTGGLTYKCNLLLDS